jgi:signal transduction histidine kinase
MRSWNALIAGFIAVVLAVLTASLLILSFRVNATLADLTDKTDRVIKLSEEIHALLSDEVASILGFQATGKSGYSGSYQAHRTQILNRLSSLAKLTPSLGAGIQPDLKELESAIDAWHHSVDSGQLTTRSVSDGEFRRVIFEDLSTMRRAQVSADRFSDVALQEESAVRARMQRLAYLFIALAVIFGPMALSALVLMTYVLRRLNATTAYMEARAEEEEALRRVAHSLNGGLSLDDVLRTVTEAAARLKGASDACIEMVDPSRNEVTSVAGKGNCPAVGSKCFFVGSVAEDVLKRGQPQIIQNTDLDGERESTFRNLARTGNRSAMVVPLVAANQPLGVLYLTRADETEYTHSEIATLRILADMGSVALHRALTVDKLQKIEDEEHFLARAFGTLGSSLDYRHTLKKVADVAVPEIGDWSFVHLVEGRRVYHAQIGYADPAKSEIAQQLLNKHRMRPDLTLSVETVIRTRHALLIPELSEKLLREHSLDEEHFNLLASLDLRSSIIVPLTVRHETFGALQLMTVGNRRFHTDELQRAKRLARKAALAIRHSQLYALATDAIQARDEVLRAVAHDLRNPLTTISMSANLLAKSSSTPYETEQKLLHRITGASQRMNHLIDDLLAIGRLRAGQRFPLDLHREDPVDIIEDACDMMRSQALEKSLVLQCNKPWIRMPAIIVDRSRILQVFTNLMDNAFKFTPRGGTITVSCEASSRDVRFAVTDTGRGIEPADVEKIFDPYWQTHGTAHLGVGLGLAIVKALIEQHHGRIWVESAPGVGTTVFFTIPVPSADEAPLKAA